MTSPRTGWFCWSLTITGRTCRAADLEVDDGAAGDERGAQLARADLERLTQSPSPP